MRGETDRWLGCLLLAVLLVLAGGCEDDGDSGSSGATRGRVIRVESIGDVSPAFMGSLAAFAGFALPVQPEYTVTMYRIVYETIDTAGRSTEASGALFVPAGAPPSALISLQHGSVTHRDHVASVAPLAYGLDGLLAASQGLVACSPDYLGYGRSELLHPYLHRNTSAAVVVDILRAARTWCRENDVALSGELFLGGYSEGGYVTMAALRAIEIDHADEFTVTAAASLSGPHDLSTVVRTILADPADRDTVLVAFFVTAYDGIYGWDRLGAFVRAPYAAELPGYFDGTWDADGIEDRLPATIGELLAPGFPARYLAGEEPDLAAAVAANSVTDWAPRAPLRLYHGTADRLVPYASAVASHDAFAANGSQSVELITVEGGGHEDAILASLPSVLAWLLGF